MVIEPKHTTIAYRCPTCGKGVLGSVGLFHLHGDMIKLKCECGGSELTATKTGDGKIRLTVPCIMCPKPHNFTVSETIFFGRDLFMLQCPYSDVNIGFLGEEEKVSEGLHNTELELLDMLGEENIEKLGNIENTPFTDPQIFDIIMFVIHDLEAEGKISCKCEDGACDPGVEVLDDGIKVFCKKCGASQIIPTDSLLGAHAFLNCDKLNLE